MQYKHMTSTLILAFILLLTGLGTSTAFADIGSQMNSSHGIHFQSDSSSTEVKVKKPEQEEEEPDC